MDQFFAKNRNIKKFKNRGESLKSNLRLADIIIIIIIIILGGIIIRKRVRK